MENLQISKIINITDISQVNNIDYYRSDAGNQKDKSVIVKYNDDRLILVNATGLYGFSVENTTDSNIDKIYMTNTAIKSEKVELVYKLEGNLSNIRNEVYGILKNEMSVIHLEYEYTNLFDINFNNYDSSGYFEKNLTQKELEEIEMSDIAMIMNPNTSYCILKNPNTGEILYFGTETGFNNFKNNTSTKYAVYGGTVESDEYVKFYTTGKSTEYNIKGNSSVKIYKDNMHIATLVISNNKTSPLIGKSADKYYINISISPDSDDNLLYFGKDSRNNSLNNYSLTGKYDTNYKRKFKYGNYILSVFNSSGNLAEDEMSNFVDKMDFTFESTYFSVVDHIDKLREFLEEIKTLKSSYRANTMKVYNKAVTNELKEIFDNNFAIERKDKAEMSTILSDYEFSVWNNTQMLNLRLDKLDSRFYVNSNIPETVIAENNNRYTVIDMSKFHFANILMEITITNKNQSKHTNEALLKNYLFFKIEHPLSKKISGALDGLLSNGIKIELDDYSKFNTWNTFTVVIGIDNENNFRCQIYKGNSATGDFVFGKAKLPHGEEVLPYYQYYFKNVSKEIVASGYEFSSVTRDAINLIFNQFNLMPDRQLPLHMYRYAYCDYKDAAVTIEKNNTVAYKYLGGL